ncbi:hypothetical protein BKA70DRAFT_1323866 [Coprinopsis sp. MPI-PUGE-AT-0042]|nr:hypothetical protein BKA70DRAFT_1323866 [Coprinopsis sp. MPI-PUGE-AT-0042]
MSWYYWDKALPGWNAVTEIDEDAEDREKKWIHSRHGIRFMFCLQGAREMNKDRSLCLFPALMKSEFHGIRKTIEAYSNDGRIGWDWGEGKNQAGGVARKKDGWRNDKNITTQYEIALYD